MKASELRIGNWYKSVKYGCPVVCNLSDLYELYHKADGAYNDPPIDEVFEPIPLTEEWLLKFRFKEIGKTKVYIIYEIMQVHLQWCDNKLFWVGCFGSERSYFPLDDSLFHIKYVHQLQNLYYALTGEEL